MAEKNITYAELLQILELIKSTSRFAEVHLKFGDIEIELSRGTAQPSYGPGSGTLPTAAAAGPPPAASNADPKPSGEQPSPVAAHSPRCEPRHAWATNSILIRSPMLGTFYRAPAPGAPPFVEIGQVVEPDTTVCIMEVMKLMTSIPAGAQGTITHILAENAELVEHEQILMVIAPR